MSQPSQPSPAGTLKRFKPAVSKTVLLFMAGLLWAAVGAGLLTAASVWLWPVGGATAAAFAGIGVAAGVTVYRLGFLRVVDKNLQRLLPLQEKRCLFSFVPWRSYVLAAVMVAMGATLRHSSVPRHYLASLYIAMGLALSLSGVRYLRAFAREARGAP